MEENMGFFKLIKKLEKGNNLTSLHLVLHFKIKNLVYTL